MFFDIAGHEIGCYGPELNDPVAVAFSEDGQCFLLGVEVIELEGCDFTGSGAGVEQKMQQGIVPEAIMFFQIDRLENRLHFLLGQEADQVFLTAFLGDTQNHLCGVPVFGVHETDHFGQRLQAGQTGISGSCRVVSPGLKMIQKINDQLEGQVFGVNLFYGHAEMI